MTTLPIKWIFFFLLIVLQVLVGVLYKISQSHNAYAYSTYSVMAMAEAGKFAISLTLHCKDHTASNSTYIFLDFKNKCTIPTVLRLNFLALLYFLNNQLAFKLFLWADPASINLLKAGSSFITAMIWSICLGQVISLHHWGSIILQVAGLISVQVDACKNVMLLQPFAYMAIALSVVVTSLSSVWNEQQLKTLPLSLHQQNIILYMTGMCLNSAGHTMMKVHNSEFPSFFQGYTWITLVIIVVNSCFGVVVTGVYKYADAVLKTLASACTTVVLLLISMAFFGLPLNIVRCCGCVVVLVAVAQYASLKHNPDKVISCHTRRAFLLGFALMVVLGFTAAIGSARSRDQLQPLTP